MPFCIATARSVYQMRSTAVFGGVSFPLAVGLSADPRIHKYHTTGCSNSNCAAVARHSYSAAACICGETTISSRAPECNPIQGVPAASTVGISDALFFVCFSSGTLECHPQFHTKTGVSLASWT